MRKISWLHISDIHFAYSDYHVEKAKESFLKKLKEFRGKVGYVFLSGDLRYGKASPNKYPVNTVECIKNDIINVLKVPLKQVFIVPGNHDVDRGRKRDRVLADVLKEYDSNKGVINKEDLRELKDTQKKYASVYKKITGREFVLGPKLVKGEICNFLLLNTSLLCGRDGEDGTLIIGMELLRQELFKLSDEDKKRPTIVIGHHSIDCLQRKERENLLAEFENINVVVYLCGHNHVMRYNEYRTSNGHGFVEYMCGTNMDLDPRNDVPTEIGFFLGCLDIENGEGYVESYKWLQNPHQKWVKNNDFVIPEGKDEGINRHFFLKTEERKQLERDIRTLSIIKKEGYDGTGANLDFNTEKINIYETDIKFPNIIAPHKHNDYDEVTYVNIGELYAFIDNSITVVKCKQGISMPRGKYHTFIGKSIPCQYLTISVTSSEESNWQEKIEDILRIASEIEDTGLKDESVISDIDKLMSYLRSSILEIRWEAIKQVKRILSLDNDFSRYINDEIENALASDEKEIRLWGINMATEFCNCDNILIQHSNLEKILLHQDRMSQWVSAYLILKNKESLNFERIYKKLYNKSYNKRFTAVSLYQVRVVLGILELFINFKGELLDTAMHDNTILKQKDDGIFDISDIEIIKHFFLWYISGEEINKTFLKSNIMHYENLKNDEKILKFVNDTESNVGIQEVIKCLDDDKILSFVKCFFDGCDKGGIQKMKIDGRLVKKTIKEYLRIIVSEQCNLQCEYCHKEGRKSTISDMKIVENPDFNLSLLLEKGKELGFKKIKLSGGEPLLYKNILKICSKYENEFEDIGFTTNGTQLVKLKEDLVELRGSKLSFNVTINSLKPEKYYEITKSNKLKDVIEGIELLIGLGYKVKINSVITSYNKEDIKELIEFAISKKIDIKFLDLVVAEDTPERYQHITVQEIKEEIMSLYNVSQEQFEMKNDYLLTRISGINVLIPLRVYSVECQYNCNMYPCAEGLFGIRVYEDYTLTRCFKGKALKGGLEEMEGNVKAIRQDIDSQTL